MRHIFWHIFLARSNKIFNHIKLKRGVKTHLQSIKRWYYFQKSDFICICVVNTRYTRYTYIFSFYQHRNKHSILTELLRIASNEIPLFHYVSHLLMQNSNRKISIWNADCMGCTIPIHLFYQMNVFRKKNNVHELALMSSIWFVFDEYFMHKNHCISE